MILIFGPIGEWFLLSIQSEDIYWMTFPWICIFNMNISIFRHLIRALFNEDYQHTFSSSQREQCVLVDCCEWYSPAVGHWYILHPARDVITLSHPARGKPCGLLWIVLSSRKALICLSSRQRFYYTFSPSRKEWFHPSGLLWLVLSDHQALFHISFSQSVQMVDSSVFRLSIIPVRQVSLKHPYATSASHITSDMVEVLLFRSKNTLCF